MRFAVNTSPMSGREGTQVTTSKLIERLRKETLKNVSIQVEESGVGRLLPRQGPRRVPARHPHRDAQARGLRALRRPARGDLQARGRQEARAHRAPLRGLQRGLRGHRHREALGAGRAACSPTWRTRAAASGSSSRCPRAPSSATATSSSPTPRARACSTPTSRATRSTAATSSTASPAPSSPTAAATAVTYGLYHLEPRGRLFVVPGDPVYEGMVVGEHNLDTDLNVNPAKPKKLSNMRSVLKDEALTLDADPGHDPGEGHPVHPRRRDGRGDPGSIRIRKTILAAQDRKAAHRDASS